MIPVSLTIKGLYSYQTEQTIEFDRLLEGQLFGIFGSVGSGKSSILEAMTFALYGQSERLDRNDNRNYNMMNLKSDELLIDFVFRNFDEQEYRFTVRGKRNGKDFDKVNTFERIAYRKTDGNWIPLEQSNADSILGLGYDNFRRTVIIPQGKFQEFLQLGDKDRTNMLKEIFQLDKYEFFYQTTALEKKNNEALQNLEGRLAHYAQVSQDGIEQQEKAVAELLLQLEGARAKLLEAEEQLQIQQALKKLFEDLENQKLKLARLLQDEEYYGGLAKKIKDYDFCLGNFRDGLKRKKELQADISHRAALIVQNQERLDKSSKELASLEQRFDLVKLEYQKQEERTQLVGDYRLLKSIKALGAEIEKQAQRLIDGKPHIELALFNKTLNENRIDDLKILIKDQRSALPDVAKLSLVRAWHGDRKNIELRMKELQGDLQVIEHQLKALAESLKSHLVPPVFPAVVDGQPFTFYQEQVLQFRQENSLKKEALLSQIAHYNLQLKLGEFVEQLSNGGPCLLCGSEHHPNLLAVDNVNDHLLKAKNEEEEIRKYDKSCEDTLQVLHGLQQNELGLLQQLESAKQRLAAQEQLLIAHLENFTWTEFDRSDESQVEQAFGLYDQEKQKLDSLEKDLEETEKKCREASESYEKFRKAMEAIQSVITAKEAERSALCGQLRLLKDKEYLGHTEQDLQGKADELEQKILSVRKEHEDLLQQIEAHRSEKITLLERINSNLEVLKKDEAMIEQINASLQQCLEKSDFSSWEEVDRILKEELDLNKLKSELQGYEQELYSCRQILQDLEKNTSGMTFDPQGFTDLLLAISQLKEQLQVMNDEYVKARAELEKQQSDLKSKLMLEDQLDKLKKRASNLNILKQLFKGSGFVNYVSSVYLHSLCEAANERFYKLTRQSLRLEVTEKNEFQVRDFLNNGKVRSVKTLSGGQTFQASLSLALALAESVQQQNKAKQNFFFLDEGFGSLDKESLQVAFETLKSLRKENRKVGVISHVEDLQQEIDVFLRVTNDSLSGSRVKASWE
ncbi:AAA family ATPase [Desertivirga brevis]|uniref:AAA family ATPase n=1 Tax=Desertivirga brevis TaxID=2810310 RepID=UPI001A964AAD|nr:SMC family ATPase [Pedobacter sp. SYSU D00873]